MAILYKLTDKDMQTHGGFQWVLGKRSPRLSGAGALCGPGYYHAYLSPATAVFFNAIHANFRVHEMRLFIARGIITLNDHDLKVGCRSLVLTEELPVPGMSDEQPVKFAILCARRVYYDLEWTKWSAKWLDGIDRSAKAALEALGIIAADEARAGGSFASAAARAASTAAAIPMWPTTGLRAVADAAISAAEARASVRGAPALPVVDLAKQALGG